MTENEAPLPAVGILFIPSRSVELCVTAWKTNVALEYWQQLCLSSRIVRLVEIVPDVDGRVSGIAGLFVAESLHPAGLRSISNGFLLPSI